MDQPRKQQSTVDAFGKSHAKSIYGVKEFFPITQQDERGSLCEIYSKAWGFDDYPMVHTYLVTARPGMIKGWALHENQVDRYFFAFGSSQLVLYDARESSPTHGLVTSKVYSECNRALVSVPPGVWHAIRCVSQQDSVLFNLPSEPYNHAQPDKLVLPVENDLIPYRFETNGYQVS